MKSVGKDLYEGKIDDGWILTAKDTDPPEYFLNGIRMNLEDIITAYKSKKKPGKEEPKLKILPDDIKEWRLNDKCHREDGPAVEYPDGSKEWWLNNEEITIDTESNDPKVKALQALM